MSRVTATTDLANCKPEELPRFAELVVKDIVQQLNGGIGLENFACKLVSVNFASANADTAVSHGLGRVPQFYLVGGRSAAMTVYNGATPNNASTLYLRSTAAGTVTLLVF